MRESNFFNYKSTAKEPTRWCNMNVIHVCTQPDVIAYAPDFID
ncbi:hypothetical protein [Oceanirhabdus sp. W0125-5]|nr:hypothetical protein [Oceanirhabdus sp. W0125-5]WBW96300.1 hypothetical protein OW730_21785 [Oceanirhabdus sp. W0125-5]